ncbi:MAG: AAA family ATPase, partial [Rhodospirillales bacterium]
MSPAANGQVLREAISGFTPEVSAATAVQTSADSQGDSQADSPIRLAVRQLRLTGFRCYAALRLDTQPGCVVLSGANGAGKTNILEAVSLLAPGRGLRRAKLEEMARREAEESAELAVAKGWAVAAQLD